MTEEKKHKPRLWQYKQIAEARLPVVAELRLHGYSYRQIQQEVMARLGLETYSLGTVKKDVHRLLQEWREQRLTDTDEYVQHELAVIDCVYDTQAQITDENIEFYRTQPEGFTLSKLQNGSSEIPSGMGAAAYWLLEYSGTADASVALQGLPQEISSFMVNPWGITWLDVIYTSGLCQIDFNLSEWTEGSTECYINFHNSDNMLPVCIICRATGLGSQTEGDGSAE